MRIGWSILLGLALAAILGGCGKNRQHATTATSTPVTTPTPEVTEDTSTNGAPVVKGITLSPLHPTVRDTIRAEVKTFDPDGDDVTVRFRWLVNGRKVLGEISETLPPGKATHGDKVQVEATPFDARNNEGEPFLSKTITVRNSPPELVEQLRPGQSVNGYRFKVTDPDGDPITFQLENAPPSMRIDPDGTIRWSPDSGDKPGLYKVKMVASDGQGGSVTVTFPVQVTPPG